MQQDEEDTIIAEGKHQAIVDHDIFEKAQEKLRRKKEEYAPRVRNMSVLKNIFASVLVCGNCGNTMKRSHPTDYGTYYYCSTNKCCKRIKCDKLDDVIVKSLLNVELPNLEAKVKNGDGHSASLQKTLVARLEKQMTEYKAQEETQYELLETRKYTQELFEKRNAILREKMDECQAQLTAAKRELPNAVNYEEKVVALKEAISGFTDDAVEPLRKNRLLKSIVKSIKYTSKFDQPRGVNDFSIEIDLKL